MVAVDSTFLPLLLGHPTRVPPDPASGLPAEYLSERVDLLIKTLEDNSETILIPTPVLSEFLVLAKQDGPRYVSLIEKDPLFKIVDFDQRAAIELATMRLKEISDLSKGALKRQPPTDSKAKISFDRQIVAIAQVNQAHTIYSDDQGVHAFATANKINVIRNWELPRPDVKQKELPFDEGKADIVRSAQLPGSDSRSVEGEAGAEEVRSETSDTDEASATSEIEGD